MAEQHNFIFSIPAIKQLVEQRTSILGKMRGSESEPHLLDRLSLTEGESFLTDEWLEEAVMETYDWIKAFGRNVTNAVRILPDGILHTITENHGAYIEVDGKRKGLSYKQSIPAGNVNGTDRGVYDGDTIKYGVQITLPSTVGIVIGQATEVYYSIIIDYTTGIAGAPIEDKKQHVITRVTTQYYGVDNCSFNAQLSTVLGNMVVKSIDSVEVKVTKVVPAHFTLQKGDYILVNNADGSKKYGIVGENYDSNNNTPIIAEIMDGDLRNSIVMKVELPDWQDRNMLPMVERNLKDALSYFVIWRWFEDVYPPEAESFREKWEEKAHQAQLGLNTEKYTIQRKSTWL